MSEVHEIAADIVADRAASTTDPVRNLRTGLIFTAEIDGSPDPVLVMTELGEDAREVVLLNVTSQAEAAQINSQDKVQFTLFGHTTTHTILKRRNNAANVQAQFWAAKVAPGKDT